MKEKDSIKQEKLEEKIRKLQKFMPNFIYDPNNKNCKIFVDYCHQSSISQEIKRGSKAFLLRAMSTLNLSPKR